MSRSERSRSTSAGSFRASAWTGKCPKWKTASIHWSAAAACGFQVGLAEKKDAYPCRLSGGQQARTALARTLSHAKPLIVLDDPFAALDRNTEEEIFRELKAMSKDRIILLISHRLYLFDQMDQVIWMENGQTQTGTHEKMLQIVPEYANLCKGWKEGADHA